MIKPDYLNGWTYHPEFTTADTSSTETSNCLESTIHINDSAEAIADAIDRRIDHIYNEREANMVGVKFNELEKELKELGIELSTIRQSSEEVGCEIEGYFRPDIYKIHRAKEICSVPITPKKPIPKKVKFSGPATIILWEDGTKTVVKCQKEDVWSDEVGIVMCYMKKMLGNKGNFNNIFREAMKVAEVQYKKEDLNSAKTVEIKGDSYYSSALNSMKRDISEINDFMKDAADVLDKALGGKK